MAAKKKTNGNGSGLSFKLSKKPTTGCKYVVVKWMPGKGSSRSLISCHRKKAAANKVLSTYKKKKKGMFARNWQFGVYNVASGKKG